MIELLSSEFEGLDHEDGCFKWFVTQFVCFFNMHYLCFKQFHHEIDLNK